jgi:hypothetical protein
MVFVTQDASETCNPEFDALAAMLGNDWKLFTTSEQEFAANWKIVAEGFLEGYHIRSTHHDTFYPIQYDNLNVIEVFGQNSRVTFPYRRIEKLRDVEPAARKCAGMLTPRLSSVCQRDAGDVPDECDHDDVGAARYRSDAARYLHARWCGRGS